MFEDRYAPHDSRLVRVLRTLSASLRVGRFFDVEVRVYWLTLLFLPLISLWGLVGSGLSWGGVLGLATFFTASFLLIIYSHEMSHIAAGWRYGIRTPLITISPMGGLAHMDAAAPSPKADLVISLAGPGVHLIWLALLAPFHLFGEHIFPATNWWLPFGVWFLWTTNLMLMVFNLLPCYPMDGGRVLRSLLAMRLNPNRATVIAARVGMVGAVLIGLAGLFWAGFGGMILVAIGISNFMACSRAIVVARHQISPYGVGPGLAPWEADPEAWKTGSAAGYVEADKAPKQPGRLKSWLAKRQQQSEEDLASEVDRILAKISKVGMGGLTRAEKRTLMRGSKAAREKRDP